MLVYVSMDVMRAPFSGDGLDLLSTSSSGKSVVYSLTPLSCILG